MKILLNIPDDELFKELNHNSYILLDEGVKSFLNLTMLYTNGMLDSVVLDGDNRFKNLAYTTLPNDSTNEDVAKAIFDEGMNIEDLNWWKSPFKMKGG